MPATNSAFLDFELPAAILLKERLEKVTAILQIDVSRKHEGVYGDPPGSNGCHRRSGAELDGGPAQRTPSAEGPLGGAEAGAEEAGRKPGEHVRRHGFSLVVSLWSPRDVHARRLRHAGDGLLPGEERLQRPDEELGLLLSHVV